MHFKSTFAAFLTCFSFAFCVAQQTMPDVDIKTLDGKTVNIQDYANNGKITIVSFWATWCTPCKKELDAFAEYYEEWQEDYDAEIIAITIDTRRALSKVKPMVEQKGWEFDVLSDSGSLLKDALNFQTIPQTFILDKNGKIAYSHNGYVPGDEEEVENTIEALAK